MMETILQALSKALPPEAILNSVSDRTAYSADKSPEKPPLASVVVIPYTEEQVQAVILIANTHNIPIVPRGTGTGTTGGAVAIQDAITLSFERLNKILEIDTANRIAVVEPGVLTGDLQKAVEAQGLFYPPDPASLAICTLGGNVAENAGGPRGLKYGVTRDYVLGLEGYWADGTKFKLGGKQYKNVAGYDLIRLLVGSEGTLGVITTIYLKLLPLPLYRRDLLVCFDKTQQAVRWLSQVHQLDVIPATAELMDDECVKAASAFLGLPAPFKSAGAYVLLSLDGSHEEILEKEIKAISDLCVQSGALQVEVASNSEEQAKLWQIRQAISPALKRVGGEKLSHDIVVPPSRMGEYFEALKKISDESGFKLIGYGHLGDGNIHVNILKLTHSATQWETHKQSLSEQVLQAAVDLGGTLTGEHGIGLTKKAYLSMVFSPQDIALLKGIKQVFDPRGILNPGKIV